MIGELNHTESEQFRIKNKNVGRIKEIELTKKKKTKIYSDSLIH